MDPSSGLVPIAGWIRTYQREWLRRDLVAGVVVAALIVPKNLGYAGIAGVPLQNGLYAAAAGAILYGIFGTCRQISMGPSSGLAAVAAGAVLAAGISDQQAVASFVAGITLASGLLFVLLAVLKMGWIAQFLSRAVVTGFLFGAAIDVVIGELPKLTGTDASGDNSFQELRSWVGSLSETEHDHAGGGRQRAGRRLRPQASRASHSRRPGAGRGRAARAAGCWTWRRTVSLSSARSRAVCPPSRFPTWG